MDSAVDLVTLRSQAASIWMALLRPCILASLSSEISAVYYTNGDQQRAKAHARMAIGEAASAWAIALDTRDELIDWVPIAEPMATAARVYVEHLEAQLMHFQRKPRFRAEPFKFDHKAKGLLERYWSAADAAVRQLYAKLNGDPNDLVTFPTMYEQLKL